jgi:hypothetical protein
MREWIKIFVRMFVVVIGLIGNLLLIIFFSRKRDRLKFYNLMTMLSVYNVCMILMDLLIFSVPFVSYYHYVIMTAYSFLEIGVTGSIYSTIAISAERYLVVCHPFYADSHNLSTKTQVSLVTLFSLVYNIPTMFELQTFQCKNENIDTTIQCQNLASIRSGFVPEIQNSCANETKVFLVPTELRCNKNYFLIYHIGLDLCFKCVIPFVTLTILNCLIIKTLAKYHAYHKDSPATRRSTIISVSNKVHCLDPENLSSTLPTINNRMERQEIRLAVTNLVIVLIFIICHSVIWIPKIYEALMGTHTDMKRVFHGFKLGYFFTALNSSINCYVYFFTHYDPMTSFKSWLQIYFQRLFNR